jgi:2-polyprenyl-6-methoxyphenol hydroxylase-like FAD-dependent oxidoreductase
VKDHQSTYDVIIAGAGPVGLFLACELRLGGVSVLILERAEEACSPLKQLPFGMRGLSLPTVEALYRRGILDEIKAPLAPIDQSGAVRGVPAVPRTQQPRLPGGHFAGIQFFQDKIDIRKWRYRLDGPADTHLATTMERVETVLAARAAAMGAEILRGHGVETFEQFEDGVTVVAGGYTFSGRWLVGCDGGRSIVRKRGKFDFVGTNPEFTGYSVLVQMADPDQLPTGRRYTPNGMYTYQKPGTIAMVDFDGGAFHRTQPATLDHVQAVLRHVSGIDAAINSLEMATTWTDRAYQTTAYRDGRALLAGDAAHIHSPLGGQGLNLGLGDAMNLGWKLAATIRGDGPAGLLDTYGKERHPIGARVLDWSRAQVALMRPSPSSRALEAIFRDLIETSDGATYFAERVWAMRLRYDLGSTHPLVGASAPDLELTDGTRLGNHLKTADGLLLSLGNGTSLVRSHQRFGRIRHIASDAKDRLGLSALLVRPDGVVIWVAEGPEDFASLEDAAAQWFGCM